MVQRTGNGEAERYNKIRKRKRCTGQIVGGAGGMKIRWDMAEREREH